MRYALNIADLAKPEMAIPNMMLIAPVAQSRLTHDMAPDRGDEQALILECTPEHAEAICDALNVGRYRVRTYVEGPKGGWSPRKNR